MFLIFLDEFFVTFIEILLVFSQILVRNGTLGQRRPTSGYTSSTCELTQFQKISSVARLKFNNLMPNSNQKDFIISIVHHEKKKETQTKKMKLNRFSFCGSFNTFPQRTENEGVNLEFASLGLSGVFERSFCTPQFVFKDRLWPQIQLPHFNA